MADRPILAIIAVACSAAFFALGWWWRGQAETATRLWREYWRREVASLPPDQVAILVGTSPADGEQTGGGA